MSPFLADFLFGRSLYVHIYIHFPFVKCPLLAMLVLSRKHSGVLVHPMRVGFSEAGAPSEEVTLSVLLNLPRHPR